MNNWLALALSISFLATPAWGQQTFVIPEKITSGFNVAHSPNRSIFRSAILVPTFKTGSSSIGSSEIESCKPPFSFDIFQELQLLNPNMVASFKTNENAPFHLFYWEAPELMSLLSGPALEKFDRIKWLKGLPRYKQSMLADLVQNQHLIGMAKVEAEALLGPSSNAELGEMGLNLPGNALFYNVHIAPCYLGTSPYLVLYYGEGRIVSAQMVTVTAVYKKQRSASL